MVHLIPKDLQIYKQLIYKQPHSSHREMQIFPGMQHIDLREARNKLRSKNKTRASAWPVGNLCNRMSLLGTSLDTLLSSFSVPRNSHRMLNAWSGPWHHMRKKYLPCCFLGYYISLNKPGKCFLLHPLLDFSEYLAVP